MIEYLAFFLIAMIAGAVFLKILFKEHILNTLEFFGLSFGIGLGLNSLFVFILSWSGVPISKISILGPLVLSIFAGTYFLFKANRLKPVPFKEFLLLPFKARLDMLDISLIGLPGIVFFSVFYSAIGFTFTDWDEYSYWGVATKAIMINKSVYLNDMVSTMENYPLFLPITAASANIMVGSFSENFSRAVIPFFLFFTVIYLLGYFQRLGMLFKERLYFSAFLILSSAGFTHLSTMLYADIPFTYFYTAAVLTFLANVFKEKQEKGLFILSGILFGLASFTKVEGLQVSLISVLFLFFVNYLVKRKEVVRKNLVFFYGFLPLTLLWALYKKAENLQALGAPKMFENTGFALANLHTILGKMYLQATKTSGWGDFWIIALMVFFLGLIFFRKNKMIIVLGFLIGLNIVFLLSAYLFYFSRQELLAASSFGRYLSHYFPLACVMLGLFYMELKALARRVSGYEG